MYDVIVCVERSKGYSASEVRFFAGRDGNAIFEMLLCKPEVDDVHVFVVLREHEVGLGKFSS